MKASRLAALVTMALFCMTLFAGVAAAAEKTTVLGKVKSYDLPSKSVTITTKDGKDMTFTVENESALKKLDDRITEGDEVKIKYVNQDGKNVIKGSNDLKGTKAGC